MELKDNPDYKRIGGFTLGAGQELLKLLASEPDKTKHNEIVKSFIVLHRDEFFTEDDFPVNYENSTTYLSN